MPEFRRSSSLDGDAQVIPFQLMTAARRWNGSESKWTIGNSKISDWLADQKISGPWYLVLPAMGMRMQMVIEWMGDIKGGKHFSVILEALYQTMLTKEKLEKMVSDSDAKMDEFALVIQAVNGLKNGYREPGESSRKTVKRFKIHRGIVSRCFTTK